MPRFALRTGRKAWRIFTACWDRTLLQGDVLCTGVTLGGWSEQPKMVLTRRKSASPYAVGIIKAIINEKTP
jgi:hypothetical protein